MMKIALLFSVLSMTGLSCSAFVTQQQTSRHNSALFMEQQDEPQQQQLLLNRKDFVFAAAASVVAASSSLAPQPAWATGRATLEQAYRRYAPRIRAGGAFYATDLKELVKKSDWTGIQAALREVPERQKGDLNKPDGGVAARAAQAGGFSDARVLVAADLFASAFSSQNSITPKTKTMKTSVEKLRATISEMDNLTKQALGQDTGGLFGGGLFKKKVSEAELAQQMRTLYAQGGNAWNEYVYAANDELALQFDKFDYIR